jgi:phosphate-selective porin
MIGKLADCTNAPIVGLFHRFRLGHAQELHLGLVHHLEAIGKEGLDDRGLRSRIRDRPGYPLDDDRLRDDDTDCRAGSKGKETENQQT